MTDILLTGAAGFIGARVAHELLARGYRVHAVRFSAVMPEQPKLVQHRVDLMDSAAVDAFLVRHRFGGLLHLAWYTGAKCHSTNVNIDWVIASLNLLRGFIKSGGTRFLGAGSVSEYDFRYGYLVEGQTPLASPSLYGQCKAALYNMAGVLCRQNNVDFKWARIFNLYGPGEKANRLMPSAINSMLKGEAVRVSDCRKIQDYLHVFDTARGIVDLYESAVQGAVNICSGVPVRLSSIIEKIAELTHSHSEILWGAIPANFDDPFVVGGNARLTSEVGWKPQISLEEGLDMTINWWRTQHVQ